MNVKVAKSAGFCMGVRKAMKTVLLAAGNRKETIYTYGALIHNPQVLRLLEKRGIKAIERLDGISSGTIVIRAHGIAPKERAIIKSSGLNIIDATCPRVARVQGIIKSYTHKGYIPIIVGEKDHPEVIGLLGFSEGKGWVIDHPDLILSIPYAEKVVIVAQTTQNEDLFMRVAEKAREKFPECKVFNTICDSTRHRQTEVTRLAKSVEGMIVVGGKNSGNTRRLTGIAQASGVKTFHVETEDELDKETLSQLKSIGVTAGASTPNWMIKRVLRELEGLRGTHESRWLHLTFRLIQFLLRSNVYVALGAGVLSLVSCLLQSITPRPSYFLIAFLYTYAMHSLNHITDKDAEQLNDPARAQFYEKYQNHFIISGVIAIATSLFLALRFLGVIPFTFLLGISILGLLYNIPIVPWGHLKASQFRKLKDIPGSKTLFVALAWGTVTSLIPAIDTNRVLSSSTLCAFLFVAILVYIRSGLFDILDIQGDQMVGKETIPILMGEKKTLHLLEILCGLLAISLILMPLAQVVPSLGYVLLIPLAYMAICLISYQGRWILPGSTFEALVDTNFLLAGLVTYFWYTL